MIIIYYKVGSRFILKDEKTYIKIMAIADNYVMLRKKGASPFVKHINEMNDFLRQIILPEYYGGD